MANYVRVCAVTQVISNGETAGLPHRAHDLRLCSIHILWSYKRRILNVF